MSSTRIYHNVSKVPVVSTFILMAGNYEVYRIHKGTHPYWSPKLEAAGILKQREKAGTEPTSKDAAQTKTESNGEGAESAIRWTNLNGVPIPTLETLMPPFRKG